MRYAEQVPPHVRRAVHAGIQPAAQPLARRTKDISIYTTTEGILEF